MFILSNRYEILNSVQISPGPGHEAFGNAKFYPSAHCLQVAVNFRFRVYW
jgi:hypothetical protein